MRIAAFVALCFIWGSSWVGIKYSHTGFPPFYGAALRFAFAALILILYCGLRRLPLRVPRPLWGLLFLSGVLVYMLDYGLIYWAETHLSAGLTAVLFATHPLFMAVVAIVLYRFESFRGAVLIGLLFGFAGVAVIFSRDLYSANWHALTVAAGMAVLLGAFTAAVGSGLMKRHFGGIDAAVLCLYQMVVGAAGLGLLGFAAGESIVSPIPWEAIAAVLYLGAAASALAFTLYVWLLHSSDATTVSLIVYLTPVTAILLDWAMLGQAPSGSMLAGVLLILTGVAVSELPRYRRTMRLRASESK